MKARPHNADWSPNRHPSTPKEWRHVNIVEDEEGTYELTIGITDMGLYSMTCKAARLSITNGAGLDMKTVLDQGAILDAWIIKQG